MDKEFFFFTSFTYLVKVIIVKLVHLKKQNKTDPDLTETSVEKKSF